MSRRGLAAGVAAAAVMCGACGKRAGGGVASFDDCPVVAGRVVTPGGDTVTVCDMTRVRDTFDLPLSALFSDFDIVDLPEDDAALVAEGHVSVSEHYVGMYSSRAGEYRLFDRNGTFLGPISSRGQGPDEYPGVICDSFIDEAGGRVYLLSWMARRVLVFDLQGRAQRHIPMARRAPKSRMRVDARRGRLTVAALPFSEDDPVCWEQDFEGNVVREVAAGHLAVAPDYSNEVDAAQNTEAMDVSLFSWGARPDSLYHFDRDAGRMQPVFAAQFGMDGVKKHDYMELPDHYAVRVASDDSYSGASLAMIDKRTLRGSHVRLRLDMLGGIAGPEWADFNRGYYIANMYAHELKRQLEAALASAGLSPEMREKLQKLNSGLGEDDNSVVLLGKLRNGVSGNILRAATPPAEEHTPAAAPDRTVRKDGQEADTPEGDDRIYGFKDLALLKLPQVKDPAYFRNNSKYADRDAGDRKEVAIGHIVEKDGTTSNVTVTRSSGDAAMDSEAERLIREIVMQPGTLLKTGQAVRCGDMQIIVYFPPL